ncbi:unnamed protein product [Adineta ricciae]|uniref:ADP ribosyltransferase domain-containing protein n=1 Tax=Adineta ricciae TaxID=249248 RepID=A0A814UAX8_ADIRI|nr:unnamed protein product [Adineta ricciae]CAF1171964.1 unnamed protein product [Adineta ricciae]
MAEATIKVFICGPSHIIESSDYQLPIPISFIFSLEKLINVIAHRSTSDDLNLQHYIVLFPDLIENDEDRIYTILEENRHVFAVFQIRTDLSAPDNIYTKLRYIRRESATMAVSMKAIQFFKHEAEKQRNLNQLNLTDIYLRRAEKTKEWLMSTIRAEPCHILLIPLNTDYENLFDCIDELRKHCTRLGYSSVIIRSLHEYIPKDELYDKLPYGKIIFENEHPTNICRWLRELSPIRMYLYGNEESIQSEWSKQMIADETDHASKYIVDDDNWHTFIEHESIHENIKWNFHVKYGQTWKITQYVPIKLNNISQNLRFRSSLRRAHMTFSTRQTTVTAQVYRWFEQCKQYGYLPDEFEIRPQYASKPLVLHQAREVQPLVLKSGSYQYMNFFDDTLQEKSDFNYSTCFKQFACVPNTLKLSNITLGSAAHSRKTNFDVFSCFDKSYEVNTDYPKSSDRTYIWLEANPFHVEERFRNLIHPYEWQYFKVVDACQHYIMNQQLQYDSKIFLIARSSLAEELFRFEHVAKICNTYLYSSQDELFTPWIQCFPVIRGNYHNLDALYEQFSSDLECSVELSSYVHQIQDNESSSPIGVFQSNSKFLWHRMFVDILLQMKPPTDAKSDLIETLRRTSYKIDVNPAQIDEFKRDYQSNAAIQWYTRDTFLYRLINQALRCEDTETLFACRLFITDLQNQLSELHEETIRSNSPSDNTIITSYRGQFMSSSAIEQFRENIGNLISTNAFLSTSLAFDIAVMFAGGSGSKSTTSLQTVLFCVEIDPKIENTRPYAQIKHFSNFQEEDEVLFAVGTVFRIEKFDTLSVTNDVLVIHLQMVDENEVPSISFDFSQLQPFEQIQDRIYAFISLAALFERDNQSKHVKTILEKTKVLFFDTTDEFEAYARSLPYTQQFVAFVNSEAHVPHQYQPTKVLSYVENETHFNDLIYQLMIEMKNDEQVPEYVTHLYTDLANVYCPSDENTFYVYLLRSSTCKKDSERKLTTNFSVSSIVTFYQLDPCLDFLQSLSQPSELGNVILIFQCDDEDLDSPCDQFEKVNSIRNIYLCSKNAFNIKSRRILLGKFLNEHDLHAQLYSDHLCNAFAQTSEQLQVHGNKTKALDHLKQSEHFSEILKSYNNETQTFFE